MPDHVILHIGTGKTGSSSIQTVLMNHRERLLGDGFLIQTGGDVEGAMTQGGAEWCSSEALEIGLDQIEAACRASAAPNLVWSWEALSNLAFSEDVQRVRRIRERIPASSYRVIVYLRRQDSWLNSAYLQWAIKDKQEEGPVLSFFHWYERLRSNRLRWWRADDLNYLQVLAPWAEVFGRENIVVRVFERDQMVGRNAVDDFLAHAGIPAEGLERQDEVNRSYSLELHTLIAWYNSLVRERSVPIDLLNYLDWSARDSFFSAPGFSSFHVPAGTARTLLQECEPSNQAVAREYLGRPDGELFRDPWSEPSGQHSVELSGKMETTVPILLQLILREHLRNGQLEARVTELERQLGQLATPQ